MNQMILFTISHTGLDISVRTIAKDNPSSVPIGFHHLMKSSHRNRGFTLTELLIMAFADKSGMIGRAHCSLNGAGWPLTHTLCLSMNQ